MVVLHFTPFPQTVCRQLSSSRLTSAVTPNASLVSTVHSKSFHLKTELYNGLKIQGGHLVKQRGAIVVKASADIEPESDIPPVETNDESKSVEKLPLQSNIDQKMKMKLAKKLRLRRKRLVRKRQLRKKGRWPPSKMKKNKNV